MGVCMQCRQALPLKFVSSAQCVLYAPRLRFLSAFGISGCSHPYQKQLPMYLKR